LCLGDGVAYILLSLERIHRGIPEGNRFFGRHMRHDIPSAMLCRQETILVVDDEPMILDVGTQFLLQYGYSVITAENGEAAVRIYGQHAVDVVILDIGLPGMSGIECLKHLMAVDSSAKVIVSSGGSVNGEIEAALAIGAILYLQKPYTMHELVRVTRKALAAEPALPHRP